MGVERTDYLMWGVDVGADGFDWDKHIAELEGRPEARFNIVYDGMSGEYCYAGKILASCDDYSGHTVTKINPDDIGIDRDALASVVSIAFERDDIGPKDFSLILFSHFS